MNGNAISYHLFLKWFEITSHTMIHDTVKGAIGKE
jgi:hypothetical protein